MNRVSCQDTGCIAVSDIMKTLSSWTLPASLVHGRIWPIKVMSALWCPEIKSHTISLVRPGYIIFIVHSKTTTPHTSLFWFVFWASSDVWGKKSLSQQQTTEVQKNRKACPSEKQCQHRGHKLVYPGWKSCFITNRSASSCRHDCSLMKNKVYRCI